MVEGVFEWWSGGVKVVQGSSGVIWGRRGDGGMVFGVWSWEKGKK